MSIINQMLKDIDQRERRNSSGGRANYVYAGRSSKARKWAWALAGVAAVVILFILLWAFSLLPNDPGSAPRPTAEQLKIERVSTELEARIAELEAAEQRLAEREQALENAATRSEGPKTQRTLVDTRLLAQSRDSSAATVGEQREESRVRNEAVSEYSSSPSSNGTTDAVEEVIPPSDTESLRSDGVSSGAGEMIVERSDSRIATAPTLHRRGMESLESGESRQAMQRFQEALLVDPEYHESRLQLAALQFGRGFAADALALLRDGLQLAPNNSEFLLLKARIYDRIEQPEFALELLRNVTAQLPRDADILLIRANLASDAGEYELAVASYQQLVAWRSDQGSWWLGYGYALEQLAQAQGESDSAYTHLRESAAEAYRRAVQDARLSTSAQEFALDRREALTN